jgi:hypothetical protein
VLWRTCSRTKWLSIREAPSCYNFVQLKAKHAHKTIHCLQTDAQTIVAEDLQVLDIVQKTFADVFTADPLVSANHHKIDKILGMVVPKMTEADNVALTGIQAIVFSLKTDKSPGLDGVTSEVLRACWDFLGADLSLIVRDFWHDVQAYASGCY